MKRHVYLTPINPIFLDRPTNITGFYDLQIGNGSFSQPAYRKRVLCEPGVCGRCRNSHPEIADHTNNESAINQWDSTWFHQNPIVCGASLPWAQPQINIIWAHSHEMNKIKQKSFSHINWHHLISFSFIFSAPGCPFF